MKDVKDEPRFGCSFVEVFHCLIAVGTLGDILLKDVDDKILFQQCSFLADVGRIAV